MSSILHNPNRKDYLRPSKTLQDLKEKLGSVYIDARLIECPQNAFELTRLQKKIEELDKQRYRKLAESNREQRVLYNSMSTSKFITESSLSSLTDPIVVEIVDNKLPPPGFRFHANGNPKLQFLSKAELSSSIDCQIIGSTPNLNTASMCDVDRSPEQESSGRIDEANLKRYGEEICSSASVRSLLRPVTTRDSHQSEKKQKISYNAVDYGKEIEDLESTIQQLRKDISTRKSATAMETHNQKHNYLRAHSRTDEPEKKSRYSVDTACLTRPSSKAAVKTEHRQVTSLSSHTKCMACQIKLKHVYDETGVKQLRGLHELKTRWKVAPRGTYVKSPSTISVTNRAMSAPVSSFNIKRYTGIAQSEEILHSYKLYQSATNFPCDFRSVSAHQHQSEAAMSISLQGFRSTYGSSLRRFSSPTERENKMKSLKSRAEIETKDIALKIGDFLKSFEDDNTKKKLVADNKSYYFLNDVQKDNAIAC